jgi:hypothetical protein
MLVEDQVKTTPETNEGGRYRDLEGEPPNTLLQLTNTDAAQSILRPLCLLSAFAAEQHVRRKRA